MIDNEQIAVAPFCAILVDTLAMTVGRVAVEARFAHVCRTQSVERSLKLGDVALEELLAAVEGFAQSHLRHGRCLVFVTAGGDVHCRAELTADIPFFGREVAYSLTDVGSLLRILYGLDVVVIVVTR